MKKLLFSLICLFCIVVRASVSNITFVAFDTETTGFSPANERIIEIGAAKYRNGKIIDATLEQIAGTANGTYHFDGSRKQ